MINGHLPIGVECYHPRAEVPRLGMPRPQLLQSFPPGNRHHIRVHNKKPQAITRVIHVEKGNWSRKAPVRLAAPSLARKPELSGPMTSLSGHPGCEGNALSINNSRTRTQSAPRRKALSLLTTAAHHESRSTHRSSFSTPCDHRGSFRR
jgi:hypothetical protein